MQDDEQIIPLQGDRVLNHNDIKSVNGIERDIKNFFSSRTVNGGPVDFEGNNIRIQGVATRTQAQDRLTFNRPEVVGLESRTQAGIHSVFSPQVDPQTIKKTERFEGDRGPAGSDGTGRDGDQGPKGAGYGGGTSSIIAGIKGSERATTWSDVKQICGWLNDQGAIYALFGSWALRIWGSKRPAADIDFLIPYNGENMRLVRTALTSLPGSNISSVSDIELMSKRVLTLYDDVRIDFMFTSQGLTYYDTEIVEISFDGPVKIPVLSGSTLYRIYQWIRDIQHVGDLEFLRQLGYLPEFTGQVIDPTTPFPSKQPDMLSSSPVVDESEM